MKGQGQIGSQACVDDAGKYGWWFHSDGPKRHPRTPKETELFHCPFQVDDKPVHFKVKILQGENFSERYERVSSEILRPRIRQHADVFMCDRPVLNRWCRRGFLSTVSCLQTWCRYRFYNDAHFTVTEKVRGMNPKFNFESLHKISKSHVDHKVSEIMSCADGNSLWSLQMQH